MFYLLIFFEYKYILYLFMAEYVEIYENGFLMAMGLNEIKFWTINKYRRIHGESLFNQIDTTILELREFAYLQQKKKKMKNSFFSRGRGRDKRESDYGKYNL